MLVLNNILFNDYGKRIDYDYSVDSSVQKYFNTKDSFYIKYGIDVSNIPKSVAVIPFLSNIIPIAWFGNFYIEVDEIDEDFFNAIEEVKTEFSKQYPNYTLKGGVKAKKIIKNSISGNKSAMLFSGGVDAYATYIRTIEEQLDLITIHGADIAIEDKTQWNDFTNLIDKESLLKKNEKEYIETNVRTFYTYQVELLLKDIGWWGKVQHGLSLIGSVAPLSFIKKYTTLYIASSYTKQVDVAWGSTPEVDNKISWSGLKVIHDGYELKRQDKVDLIADFGAKSKNPIHLRVCYSERRKDFNCSNCEKCYRTILGLVLAGENPNNYGFIVNEKFYSDMFNVLQLGSSSIGMKYFWRELMEKSKVTKGPFIFKNTDEELQQIKNIANGKIDDLLAEKLKNKKNSLANVKFILRNKFSKTYALYRKLKNN